MQTTVSGCGYTRWQRTCKGSTVNSPAGEIRAWVGVNPIQHPTDCDKPCPLCFQRLHSGVLRDLERQSQKKENIRLLEEQIALTKQLMEERDKALMEKGSRQS